MTSTVLATAVAAGFLWSIMLFFAAVFIRERRQDAGFGWALAGAAIFFVVFADRLPSEPLWLRDVVTLLPGVADSSKLFESSFAALLILFVIYLFRVAVFYQLLLLNQQSNGSDSDEDIVNDVVAPVLSYLCFAICLIGLLVPAYGLGLLGTTLLTFALIAFHFWRLLTKLAPFIENLWALFIVTAARLRIAISRVVLQAIVKIAAIEEVARGGTEWAMSNWAQDRLRGLDVRERREREKRRSLLADAARSASQRSKSGAGGGGSR
jgi:hypothetical protein